MSKIIICVPGIEDTKENIGRRAETKRVFYRLAGLLLKQHGRYRVSGLYQPKDMARYLGSKHPKMPFYVITMNGLDRSLYDKLVSLYWEIPESSLEYGHCAICRYLKHW